MTPTNVLLILQVAEDLALRLAKAVALAKRGNVTNAEVSELMAEDDAARAALQAEIDSRTKPGATPAAPAPVPPAPAPEAPKAVSEAASDKGSKSR